MKPEIKYWVNDKIRMCSMTMFNKQAEIENINNGFRQVTLDEQDKFRAETDEVKTGKPSITVKASASDISKIVNDFNK